MNFYDLGSDLPGQLFDTIIFGSSFMLMPDQALAIDICKSTACITQNIWRKAERYTFY
jgi:hypothetical protein